MAERIAGRREGGTRRWDAIEEARGRMPTQRRRRALAVEARRKGASEGEAQWEKMKRAARLNF